MVALVDTNILVYRFDPRDMRKQSLATRLLREGLINDTIRIAHQAIAEFYAVVTRPRIGIPPLLKDDDARREAEELLVQFQVLFPDETVVRTALRGIAAYQMSWWDAHMWAYAETFGMNQLFSEDFQHGQLYGSVQVINPFLG